MFNKESEAQLNALVRQQMQHCGTPGVSLAVVYGNHIVYASGFGVTSSDPEQSVRVTPKTLFRIGSTTKPLTGTLLMRLAEAGKLALDEPVITYLPWFTSSDAAATPRVTLRHLMSHQSGLPWGAQFFGYRDPSGLETYVREQVPRMPLIAFPGRLFSYSNVGVNVAGCVAEAVGGAPFADLMQKWVFDPLAMERTTFDPLRAISFPLAQAHEKTPDGIQVKRAEPWAENVAYYPSAMAYSTVLDIANFACLHLNRGCRGTQLLPVELAAEMQKTQVDEYQIDGRTVGLNFALSHYRGHRRVGHGGGIASFGSVFTMLPEVGVAVIIQFNEIGFWQAAEAIVHRVFEAALEDKNATAAISIFPVSTVAAHAKPETGDRERCIGTFLGSHAGLVSLSLGDDENTLRLSIKGTPGESVLSPLRRDLYTSRNISSDVEAVVGFIGLTEEPSVAGISHIMLNGTPCVRVEPNPAFVAAPLTWHRYTGRYTGPDETYPSGLDVLELRCENDRLFVHSCNRAREEEAVAWDDDCFIYRGRLLRIQKTDWGTPPFTLTLGDPVNLYEPSL